jgi:hypothetical protein
MFKSLRNLSLIYIKKIKIEKKPEFPMLRSVYFNIIDLDYFNHFFSKFLNINNIVDITIIGIFYPGFLTLWLAEKVVFRKLKSLTISFSEILADKILENATFPNLEKLSISNMEPPIIDVPFKNLKGHNKLKYITLYKIQHLTDDFLQNLKTVKNYKYKYISIGNNDNLTGINWSISKYESLHIENLKLTYLNNFQDEFFEKYRGTIDHVHLENLPNVHGSGRVFSNSKSLYINNLQNFNQYFLSKYVEYLKLINLPKLIRIDINEKNITVLHLENLPEYTSLPVYLDNLIELTIINLPKFEKLNFKQTKNHNLKLLKLINLPMLEGMLFFKYTFYKLNFLHLQDLTSIIRIPFYLDELIELTIINLPNFQRLEFEKIENYNLKILKLINLPKLKEYFHEYMHDDFMFLTLKVIHLKNLPLFEFKEHLPILYMFVYMQEEEYDERLKNLIEIAKMK